MNLETGGFIDYDVDTTGILNFVVDLCTECSFTYIAPDPSDPDSIILTPWAAEPEASNKTAVVIQMRAHIDDDTKICVLENSAISILYGDNIQSNIAMLNYGKNIYYRDSEVVLAGETLQSEIKLTIVSESDLKTMQFGGFFIIDRALYCLAFERDDRISQNTTKLYSVAICEESLQIK